MKRRVALIEFSIFDQFPLVSGYLHAYAQTDPAVAEAFEFVYYITQVERVNYDETLKAIRALDAQVLCFSCYVWNMGLIRRLVHDLKSDRKVERIILGGHQISHHITQYIEPTDSNIVVINGQGEIPFRATLQRLADTGDLAGLKGVSFYTGGQLWNGGEAEMLANLDDIPSPFLGGQFDGMNHPTTVFETNRGCPYKCTFCTWGGDTLSVTKFSLDRIKEELTWIAKKSVMFLSLADANWGMLQRDIEISAHIAQLKKTYGSPLIVYYAAAKNKPKGSMECIEKFHEGGVITSQALGIQSLSDQTLEMVDRKNIKNQAFLQMFDGLKQRKIDSYCELIWPLPGETLESLKANFERLIKLGAQTTIMYPAILINNARLTAQANEHEIESVDCDDWKSELKLVTKTKYASRADVDDGFWFYYAYFLLGNFDVRKALLACVADATGKSYAAIISDFATYLRENASTSAYAALVETLLLEQEHGALMTAGRLGTHLAHEERLAAQRDVSRFVVTQMAGDISRALAVATLWVFSMPRVFTDTRDEYEMLIKHLDALGRSYGQALSSLVTVEPHRHGVDLHVNDATGVWREVLPFFTGHESVGPVERVAIRHPIVQRRYLAQDQTRNFGYAHGMVQRLTHISAQVSAQLAGSPEVVSSQLQLV
jgi:hypothetical protein